jgi:CRP-like cAMP-binding protein
VNAPQSLAGNGLLAAMPGGESPDWRMRLELVQLALGQVLYESGTQLGHAWFPTSAIVSLMYVTEDGSSSQIAVVGHEGLVGIPLFMGDGSTSGRAVVQGAGLAWRVRGNLLTQAFAQSAGVRTLLLHYTQALIAQMAQTAVCNRHHSVDQQLCRWLLMTLDRLPDLNIVATQELIAQLLGVRREGVTAAALTLQRAGLINYRRGRIEVLDRTRLEARSCECHGVVKAEYARLLPMQT